MLYYFRKVKEGKPKTRKGTQMPSKAELETTIRNDILSRIAATLTEQLGTDVLPVSASELAIPVLDAEQNEKWALVKVSIPRGTRNGSGYDPYDGYAAADEYKAEQDEKRAKREASKAKKEEEARQRKERAETKKAIKNLEKAIEGVE